MGEGDGQPFLIDLGTTKSQWSKDKQRGTIRNVTFDGVYVLSGMQISFVPVEVLYYSDSYIICKKDNEGGLKLYDRVVVKGKNLYDGKIIS